ncbi:MAG: hypothetical protein M0T70_05605 [Geobacteraceae bacterium]|nr:hypothetical protein [Geobacteraceae bacterium]
MNIVHAALLGALQGFSKVLPMLAGIPVSAVTGYLGGAFLLQFVRQRGMSAFVWYRVITGGVVIAAIMPGFKG